MSDPYQRPTPRPNCRAPTPCLIARQATVNLGNGRNLSVTAINQSPDNVYVERIELNGQPFESTYVTHAQLASGAASFVFYMTYSADTPYYRANNYATVPGANHL